MLVPRRLCAASLNEALTFYFRPSIGEFVGRFVPSDSRVRLDVLYADIVSPL